MKQILYVLVGLIVISCKTESKQDGAQNEIVEVQKNTEQNTVLDSIKLSKMNSSELRFIRNEIFAKHGYIFKAKELTDYFLQFDWYNPTVTADKIDKLLTDIDRKNISLIKSIENTSSVKEKKWDSEFQEYLDLIPDIQLPIKFVCDSGFTISDINSENDIIQKYKPEGTTIIGKLYQDSNEVALLYGYPADIFFPIISVFDKKGIQIRTQKIFKLGDCNGDEGFISTTFGTITSDYKIIEMYT